MRPEPLERPAVVIAVRMPVTFADRTRKASTAIDQSGTVSGKCRGVGRRAAEPMTIGQVARPAQVAAPATPGETVRPKAEGQSTAQGLVERPARTGLPAIAPVPPARMVHGIAGVASVATPQPVVAMTPQAVADAGTDPLLVIEVVASAATMLPAAGTAARAATGTQTDSDASARTLTVRTAAVTEPAAAGVRAPSVPGLAAEAASPVAAAVR